MADSKIEWTDKTWNPVRGCVKVSPGCKNCYAETFAERWRGIKGHAYEQGFDLKLVPHKLDEPLHWRNPSRIFVNSMSDLFQDGVPFEYIDKVFAVMALTPQHTYQILTKRPERMREYFATSISEDRRYEIELQMYDLGGDNDSRSIPDEDWPLPNVWLGVSVENQEYADKRTPLLLQTPAVVRFVSYEPALGPVNFDSYPGPLRCDGCGYTAKDKVEQADHSLCANKTATLDWVIVGGESGPGARPFNIQWARSVVEQCKAAGVACFVKQFGARPQGHYDPTLDVEWELIERKGNPLYAIGLKDRKGGDMLEWPEDLRVRQFPVTAS